MIYKKQLSRVALIHLCFPHLVNSIVINSRLGYVYYTSCFNAILRINSLVIRLLELIASSIIFCCFLETSIPSRATLCAICLLVFDSMFNINIASYYSNYTISYMRLHSLRQTLILFVIAFIPDDLIHPEDLLKQHDFHHLVRVGEGSEADFLIGPVLYTVSYAIAAADDEYDVAFSCVHPFLIFFSEFFA